MRDGGAVMKWYARCPVRWTVFREGREDRRGRAVGQATHAMGTSIPHTSCAPRRPAGGRGGGETYLD